MNDAVSKSSPVWRQGHHFDFLKMQKPVRGLADGRYWTMQSSGGFSETRMSRDHDPWLQPCLCGGGRPLPRLPACGSQTHSHLLFCSFSRFTILPDLELAGGSRRTAVTVATRATVGGGGDWSAPVKSMTCDRVGQGLPSF